MEMIVNPDVYLVVLMPTYNHERFIEEAIKGVTSQIAKFKYLLFIIDDCSTDKTYDICKHYSEKFPDIVVTLKNEFNIGALKTGELLRNIGFNSKAKYIAICEGDDYWTDPYKLQKQVDFLEKNMDYSICFHETMILYEDGGEVLYNNIEANKSFDIVDLLHNNFFAAVSCVFRVYEHHYPMPAWFTGSAANDYGLKLLNATKGKLYYLKDCMAVYRVHSGGIWSSQSNPEMYEHGIKIIDSLDAAFNFQYHEHFEKGKKLRFERFFPQDKVRELAPVKLVITSRIKAKLKYYLAKIISS